MTTPTSHGSLPTQWLETHSGTGASGVVSVSQLIIMFERPIQVNDFVEVGDLQGTVTRVNLRR